MTNRQKFIDEQLKLQSLSLGGVTNDVKKRITDGASGLYLSNNLEIINPRLYQPLRMFFWYRDMPIRYGGGAVEEASFFKQNYVITKGSNASGSNNAITTIKTNIEKIKTRIKPYSWIIEQSWVDQLKADQVGFDQLKQYDEGLRKDYNRQLDQIAFFGFEDMSDSYGLFNNTAVTTKTLTKKFDTMTGLEILKDLNSNILEMITDMAQDASFVPNKILVPLEFYTELVQPIAVGGTPTAVSLIDYLERNLAMNVAGYGGNRVDIYPNMYLKDKGAKSKGRIVIYCQNEDALCMPLPMELTPGATVFDTSSMSTKSSYVAFIGEPQFMYLSSIRYLDNPSA